MNIVERIRDECLAISKMSNNPKNWPNILILGKIEFAELESACGDEIHRGPITSSGDEEIGGMAIVHAFQDSCLMFAYQVPHTPTHIEQQNAMELAFPNYEGRDLEAERRYWYGR